MGKEQSPDKLQRAISSILEELKCKDQFVLPNCWPTVNGGGYTWTSDSGSFGDVAVGINGFSSEQEVHIVLGRNQLEIKETRDRGGERGQRREGIITSHFNPNLAHIEH